MIKTGQQRWFVFCLIVSLLIHLGIVLALTDIFRPWKSADRLPGQLTVLSVEFKILHLAKKTPKVCRLVHHLKLDRPVSGQSHNRRRRQFLQITSIPRNAK